MYIRRQNFAGLGTESTFLWGARQTGKSTLLKKLYPDAYYFDLLLSDEYERFLRNPSLLREILSDPDLSSPVIIDEIQRIPSLLNEVHWLIENRSIRFILSGSSPRKILHSGGNLLGGRAMRYELYPLTYAEIPDFDLLKALNSGLLPRHYMAKNSGKLLSAYIGSYLRDEIIAEAKIRNITSFSKFLEAAAFSNGEMVNFSNIAAECSISSTTVKEYFQILEDTMTGRFVQAYQKKPKRRVITSPKFYYFDVGIAGFLLKRGRIETGSEAFGKALEHYIYQEIYAYSHYSDKNFPVSYWRTASQIEVDFILGDHEVALEIKSTNTINPRHFKGLKSFSEEYTTKKSIIVSTDPYTRKIDEITVLPWNIFLERLWSGEII
jgi:predicted AAA+ superfamily ATPase